MIERILAHYEILEKIGQGGMGEVYRARDTRLGRDVALKLLPADLAADPERLARFRREARVLASLNHQSIAGIHGLEEAEGQSFLVMELAEGEDLAQRLRSGALPTDEALEIARQIAKGLAEAHERGVVHRDLKPANVKVGPDGKVKILDFGLARAFAGDVDEDADPSTSPTITAAMTQAGTILGTAAYMSPEQAKGKRIDQRADIWALGVILWEMLSGRQLFLEETVSETLASVLRQEPRWAEMDGQPPELQSLLRRCLEREPDRRYRDAADVALVLEDLRVRVQSGRFDVASTPAGSTTARVPAQAWVAIALLAMAVGVLGARALLTGGGEEAPPLRVSVNLPAEQFLRDEEPSMALSPDGLRLVYAATEGNDHRLYVRELDAFEARPLLGTEGGSGPIFSPDGRWVLFSDRDKLQKVMVDGGSPVQITDTDWYGATWISDDEIVFTPSYAAGLSRVEAAGGATEVLTVPARERGELGHWWPQALPGGEWVLFTVWSTPFDSVAIRALSLSSREQRTIVRGGTYGRYLPSGHLVFARDGKLMAQRFDLAGPRTVGAPMPVLDDVPIHSNDGNSQFAISKNGTLAYVPASVLRTPRNLVWIGPEGQQRPFEGPTRQFSAPRLSPDGRRLAVTIEEQGNADLWIHDRERGTWSRFTFGSASDFNAHWTPDGRYLYFNVEQPQFDIYRRRSDASAEAEQVLTSSYDRLVSSISPGGDWLLFTESHPQTNSDVWALPLRDGSEPREFLRTAFSEEMAAFSRDGRWVAYTSNESGRDQVYVRSFPDAGRPWQISSEGGTEARWSRDGRHLFYRNGQTFYRVAVTTGESFEAGRPEELFEVNHRGYWASAGYEESLDGSELLVVQTPPESLPRSIRVVTGWLDELRRLVP